MKLKTLIFLLPCFCLPVACGDGNPSFQTEKGNVYRVVFETNSLEKKAEIHISNGNHATIVNEALGKDSGSPVIDEPMQPGRSAFHTSREVSIFLAEGLLYTDSLATFSMKVYKDSTLVYDQSLDVKKSDQVQKLIYQATE